MTIDYAEEVLKGSPRAVARVITWLENDDERAKACMEKLYPHTGNSYVVGITGAPGAGKSSLTDKLTHHFRSNGLTVGIVAVDPTSPFTGGAILGDRVRMSELTNDPGVFIRSMATRGFLGGLSQATGNVVKVMQASGKDIILIETVGVGQDEVEVMRIADTTCLILVPGLGDVIQSMKAGVMEIADIYAINKSDLPGAHQLCAEVTNRLSQDSYFKKKAWTPPIIQTVATEDIGISELLDSITSHRNHQVETGSLLEKRRERTRQETLQMIHYELFRIIKKHLSENGRMDKMIEAILSNKENPYSLMEQIVSECIRLPGKS
ncbi:MAG: methylmalonyl Co-A mutase-associated GTPase MeaB [Desulfobacterales bacterium]|nr:methylmalonyl Co-A mutase-associated GTPase MeaB [Desulfobacterales bacterium]